MTRTMESFYAYLDRPLRPRSRIALLALIPFLILGYFFPLWRISMEAPQYPRGLYLDIYVHSIEGGDEGRHLREINTLNHYIGMRPLDPNELPDLGWMPFALGILALLTLRVAAVGNTRSLVDLAVLVVYVLGFMAARFVYRLYVYGHELDPNAPFDVEPFMPVVIGTKQIANFTTHAWPRLGTLFVGLYAVGVVALAGLYVVRGLRAGRRRRAAEARASAPPSPAPTRSPEPQPS